MRRVYDKSQDRILYEDEIKPLGPNILINPISQEQQLTWRKEFAAGVQDELQGQLLGALQSSDPFGAFKLTLSGKFALFKEWHRFKIQKVRSIIQAWADLNRIPSDTWLVARESEVSFRSRTELYAFLDQFPVERLLDLQFPIRWFLEGRLTKETQKKKP